MHVDSILRLVHVLSHQQTLNSVGLITAAQVTRELDDVYIAVNARGRNTELPKWPRVLVGQGVPAALINALRNTSPDLKTSIQRAKRASAAALWIGGFQTDAIEVDLTRHLPQRGGVAGAIRAIANRTRDLLPAVLAVLREIAPDTDMETLTQRTMLRLELGIPAELVDLAGTRDLALSRAQYLMLLGAGVRTPDDVRARPVDDLAAIMNSRSAAQQLVDCVARAAEQGIEPEALQLQAPTE